jgi:hypothetical protein
MIQCSITGLEASGEEMNTFLDIYRLFGTSAANSMRNRFLWRREFTAWLSNGQMVCWDRKAALDFNAGNIWTTPICQSMI